MFRRRSALALLLVAGLSLTVAACGGSKSSSVLDRARTRATTGDGDAQAVLASIRTNVGDQGPQKISARRSPRRSRARRRIRRSASSSRSPISIKLDGTGRHEGQEVRSHLRAGRRPDQGRRRAAPGRRRVVRRGQRQVVQPPRRLALEHVRQLDDEHVERRPAGDPEGVRRSEGALHEREARRHRGRRTASSPTTSRATSTSPRSSRASRPWPRRRAAAPSASPVSAAQIAQSVQSLQQYVKSATADLWVGQDDKQIHRFSTTVDGVTDASTKASSGIDGFKITLDVSATPTSTPSVSAPSNPAPIAQLQQDLGGLLGGLAARGHHHRLTDAESARRGDRPSDPTGTPSDSPMPRLILTRSCSSLPRLLAACASRRCTPPRARPRPFRIGMVADTNGVCDRSFNQLAYAGVQHGCAAARGQHPVVLASPSVALVRVVPARPRAAGLRPRDRDRAVRGAGARRGRARVPEVQLRDRRRLLRGAACSAACRTCRACVFKQQEAGYLAGYLAGLVELSAMPRLQGRAT